MFLDKAEVAKLAVSHNFGHHAQAVRDSQRISMLHEQTLSILWELAHRSVGPIVELGPYIGGSTTVIADAIRPSARRLLTVEKGGSYDHPDRPTTDIIADLKTNLLRFGVSDAVDIVEGHNNDPATVSAVEAFLGTAEISMLFIDSDGHVERDFALYRRFLADGAFVVLDDIESDTASEKALLVRPLVERGIREGFLHDLGIYKWGTWVGQYRQKPSPPADLSRGLLSRFSGMFR